MRALQRLLLNGWILLPVVLSIVAFHRGLGAWFQQDDFAHLQLAARTAVADLPAMLMQPVAQGTFRPISERGFYWAFYRLFGLDALPCHLFAFFLHAGNCVLSFLLFRQVVVSSIAAAAGVALWAVNPCLALPLTWVATTNQILWATCALSAVYLFVLHCDTRRTGFLLGSWALFLLGLGVLESQVAVPLVLVAFAYLFRRDRVLAACAFFVPAILFAGLHLWLIPRRAAGAYAMDFGAALLLTVGKYWLLSWEFSAAAVVAGIGLVWLLWRPQSQRVALWGFLWWLALLGPVLPLRMHVTDYYVTVPLLGAGLMASSAFASSPRLTAALLVAWLIAVVPVSRQRATAQVERSRNMQAVVLGVGDAARRQPGKTILLAGVHDALFWSGIYDNPFSLVTRNDVFLTPEAAAGLTPYPDLFRAKDYTLPPAVVSDLLTQQKAVVYNVQGRMLRQMTEIYEKSRSLQGAVSRVALSEPVYGPFLDGSWYGREPGFRWMGAKASVRLAGGGQAVVIHGFCVPLQFHDRDRIHVRAEWDGVPLGVQTLRRGTKEFDLRFDLPPAREPGGRLTLAVDVTARLPGDSRDLGLAMTRIELQ